MNIRTKGRVKDPAEIRLDPALLDATNSVCWTGGCGAGRIIFDIMVATGAFRATYLASQVEHS